MGTVNDKLNYLVDTKSRLKTAIENKSVEVPPNTTFRDFVSKVNDIITLEDGTSDATATAADIIKGKVAYIKGQRIVGTLEIPDEHQETYNILNQVNATQDGYTEPGGTDAEIEAIMDEILGNSAQKDYEDTFNILNNVDGNSDTFTDLGGTEQEVEQILDNVLNGNQN